LGVTALALALALAASAVACSEKPVPLSPGPGPGSGPHVPLSERWAEFDAASRWPTAAPPFVSRGHGVGHYRVDVRVSPEHLDAYRSLVAGQLAPDGITVVAFHRDVDSDADGPVYMMQKRTAGDWRFLVVDASGHLSSHVDLELCARCHLDAPADHLFGAPRPSSTPGEPPPAP
jgi:hypothetical protein